MLPLPADEDEYMSMHSFRSIKDLSVIPFMEAGFPVNHVAQESTYSKSPLSYRLQFLLIS